MMHLRFLGAAGTVTGSRHLVEVKGRRFLIDCGLFQGAKEIRRRNWEPFPVDPASIEALVLTHAHVDHCGWIPRLYREGFRGPVLCTPATLDLCRLLLPDAAHLQEEQAEYENKQGLSRHKPALPLFTLEEARQCLTLFQARDYHAPFEVVPEVTATFFDAGHILGSAWVELQAAGRRVVFSGDLGRRDAPILRDPEPLTRADYLVCEATYGDRLHSGKPVRDELRRILQRTVSRRGVLVIPAFAVERTQEVVYILDELAEARDIPRIPVFIDSPMAVEATRLFHRYTDYYDEEARRLLETGRRVLDYPYLKLCSTVPESRAIHEQKPPFVVLAASGMATGGRILHHLKRYLPDRDNTVLLVGYQSVGTRGWSLAQGLPRIKIFGEWVPVQAQVENLDGFSGHADYAQIMGWLGGLEQAPRRTWLVHGELPALEAMRLRLGGELGWDVVVPAHLHEEDVE